MDMFLDLTLKSNYKSNSQIARILTESWVEKNMFCPNCGNLHIAHFENNKPVADFYCKKCGSQFELKSKNGAFGRIIPDGAYNTMITRITDNSNPDFMFMSYSLSTASVVDFLFVPKHFIIPAIIEKRKPLPITARRAGWVGCNILFDKIPEQGRIPIISNSVARSISGTVHLVQKASLLNRNSIESKGWLYDVLNCVNEIEKEEFSLADVYRYESLLQLIHPDNNNIQPKIRQQLQYLRNAGVIEFLGNGHYRKVCYDENI